ncbi:hypothetical protein [Turicibacter sanguinis]|uniref:hypothetical protein n=1 Tax=Turicibacter sanguinis TaxID=154288 RepID=UPI0021D4A2B9|nr:hypothetical protein [Turicibacter sanguinis]MCU7203044.1 hypothetical protein [Turicibacter sanguinis]
MVTVKYGDYALDVKEIIHLERAEDTLVVVYKNGIEKKMKFNHRDDCKECYLFILDVCHLR